LVQKMVDIQFCLSNVFMLLCCPIPFFRLPDSLKENIVVKAVHTSTKLSHICQEAMHSGYTPTSMLLSNQ
jgi:hypothetical protein